MLGDNVNMKEKILAISLQLSRCNASGKSSSMKTNKPWLRVHLAVSSCIRIRTEALAAHYPNMAFSDATAEQWLTSIHRDQKAL